MKRLVGRLTGALALPAFLATHMAQSRDGDQALIVIDLRPREERSGIGLTPLTGPCNEDVYIVADSASRPLKVAALKTDLVKALAGAGAGKTLTVLNWTIYYNKQFYGGQPWGKIVSGNSIPLPGISPSKDQGNFPGSKCARQESTGGWFERGEVTGKFSPLVSVFEGTYAGHSVGVRVVYSPTRQLEGKFKGEVTDSLAVLGAVHDTADALLAILPR
jgi:hypothetical protein